MRVTGLVAAVVLAAGAVGFGAEGDWPRWCGANGDCTTKEVVMEKWPEGGPKELWRKTVGVGYASPIAVEGKVYLFGTVEGKDRLTCLNAENGEVVWTQEAETGYTGNKGKYPGGRATPTVDGDRIYTFGGNGDLVCRQLSDGKQLWSLDVMKAAGSKPPMWGNASCPLVRGDLVYVQAGEKGPVAIAVDKTKGEVAWKSEETGQGSYAPVRAYEIDGKAQLLTLGGTGCVAMDPATGKTLWKQGWPAVYNINAVTPVYRDGHLFITSGYGTGCAMYKVEGTTSTEVWKKKEPHDRLVPPLLEGDVLYVHNEGSLMAMSWPEGKELWKKDLKLGLGGQYVRSGERMIMVSDTGELVLAKVTPAGCEELGRGRVFEAPKEKDIWASPLVYKGKVYVKGGSELVCLEAK